MSLASVVFAAVFLASFVLGLRSTVRLYHRWASGRTPRSRLLLAFVVVSSVLTLTAGWIGILTLRRLMGLEPIPWTPVVTFAIAIVIVAIPAWLDYETERIESGRYPR